MNSPRDPKADIAAAVPTLRLPRSNANVSLSRVPPPRPGAKEDPVVDAVRDHERKIDDLVTTLSRYDSGMRATISALARHRTTVGPAADRPDATGSGVVHVDSDTYEISIDMPSSSSSTGGEWTSASYIPLVSGGVEGNAAVIGPGGTIIDSGFALTDEQGGLVSSPLTDPPQRSRITLWVDGTAVGGITTGMKTWTYFHYAQQLIRWSAVMEYSSPTAEVVVGAYFSRGFPPGSGDRADNNSIVITQPIVTSSDFRGWAPSAIPQQNVVTFFIESVTGTVTRLNFVFEVEEYRSGGAISEPSLPSSES